MSTDWTARRREAVAAQAERLARAEAAETAQARALVEAFVAAASARGLAPEELTAVGPGGGRYRTGVRGWVLRRDGRAGVGEDGAFYLLTAPPAAWTLTGRVRARLRGVPLVASDPPLVWGRGGRDGDSMPLADLLDRRLAQEQP